MKFSEFPYVRPDIDAVCGQINSLAEKFAAAKSAEEELEIIREYRSVLTEFNSTRTIASIRYTINTKDPFYLEENKFFNKNNPIVDKAMVTFGEALLKSSHLDEIKKEFGSIFITNIEFKTKSMNADVIELMQEENALNAKYQEFNANAQVPYNGKLLTIPDVTKMMSSDDRAVRRSAYQALSDFYMSHSDFYDKVYDDLVKNRTEQAKRMGFDSYTQLAYIRRNRNCYTPEDVAVFRKQIAEDIVPEIVKAKKQQSERTGIADMKIYDDAFYFADGNPKTFESADDMMNATIETFRELSPITADYINLMYEGQYYDAPSKEGKKVGAYTNFIPKYKAPFVFLNYAGAADDVTTTFHEFGHGFNGFCSRENPNNVLNNPTLDIAEIHSMSMEFMSYPGLNKFFSEEDVEKQKRSHLEHCLAFLSYGTMVDHFQHIMYDRPELTPDERNKVWLDLEKIYRPYMDFDGIEFYAAGRVWQRQQHLFSAPFYYIDYVLAQTIALQFWEIGTKDFQKSFDMYVELTKKGGTLTFTDLVARSGLKVPFKEGALKSIAEAVSKALAE